MGKSPFYETEYQRQFKWHKLIEQPVVQFETVDETPVVVEAVSEENKAVPMEKAETDEFQAASVSSSDSKTPAIIPYGSGNINPAVPANYMKSFNAKVPKSEQFADLTSKTRRALEYDEKRRQKESLAKKGKQVLEETEERPDSALRQYIMARQMADKILDRFQTEYRRQFLDWTKPIAVDSDVKQLDVKLVPAAPKGARKEKKSEKKRTVVIERPPATTEEASQTVAPTASASSQTSGPKASTSVQTAPKASKAAAATEASTSTTVEATASQTSPVKGDEPFITVPEKPVVVQALPVLEKLLPAGVGKDKYVHHEKRHYPNKQRDHVQEQFKDMEDKLREEVDIHGTCSSSDKPKVPKGDPLIRFAIEPSTLRLAQAILEKAKQRKH